MPIFHDPQDSPPRHMFSHQASSIEKQRAGNSSLIGRPLSNATQSGNDSKSESQIDMQPPPPIQGRKPTRLDRVELIQKLKRTQSPPWQLQNNIHSLEQNSEPRPISRDRSNTPLLPPTDVTPARTSTPDSSHDITAEGLSIQRPRSALHSGDFREKREGSDSGSITTSTGFLATSLVAPWHRSFPAATFVSQQTQAPYAYSAAFGHDPRAVSRARAISQSSTSSFAFLPPTSPLVQQANNPDLDTSSRPGSRHGSKSPERNNRRHTFSPASFQDYQSTPAARSASGTPAARHLRYGGSIPYQAHQPRRSMTVSQSQSQSSPQSPFLRSSRPSFSSEVSPLQHAPMVGSYEESILRGRMSTTPSRPLDFVAKIGVLGKGDCKSSLKCPPHVTVPFPAVFYSYNTGNGRISDNEPSPYVGLVDLENSLPVPDDSRENVKRKRRQAIPPHKDNELDFRVTHEHQFSGQDVKREIQTKDKRKRRLTSPRAPPGGSYRIPPQGQLQIVLKNPNKTAVKLFLVPYDVSEMESGQKTFIRQRSYSAGPIIDMPTSLRQNFGTDRPEAALSNSEDSNDRPILRYLIHLHICCPSKGLYYLYKSIRVVFANRVPDGKEKLRNEIQMPEPRYSVYKPLRDPASMHTIPSSAAMLPSEKVARRRSAGWPLSTSQQLYDQVNGMIQRPHFPPPAVHLTGGPLSSYISSGFASPMPDVQPIPFGLTRLAAIESRPASRDKMDSERKSPFRTPLASPRTGMGSPTTEIEGKFEKLSKGDIGYGGNAFSPLCSPTSPLSAGLLSQRLRGLEVQPDEEISM